MDLVAATARSSRRELGAANENPDTKFSDLNMMVGPGGRERTRDEFAALLAAGGFALERGVPSAIALTVFEGRPAGIKHRAMPPGTDAAADRR
jgi:hypothetical protein